MDTEAHQPTTTATIAVVPLPSVATALVVMTTVAEAHRLVMTITDVVVIPTLRALHPVRAVRHPSTIIHHLVVRLTLMTPMVPLLLAVVMSQIRTPMVTDASLMEVVVPQARRLLAEIADTKAEEEAMIVVATGD